MSQIDPAELELDMRRPTGLRSLSVIWLVPVIAIAIALLMAWQALSDRGPVIEIEFSNAEGLVENETPLRFRDVKVGTVEDVRFSDNLQNVIVSVRLDKDIAPLVDEEAVFWIVRPEISAQGVRGLATLLGGVYLEGSWNDEPGAPRSRFTGLEQPPFITGNRRGTDFILTAPTGGTIEGGAPIIYKGVTVGLIDRPQLTSDGRSVIARAFVNAPYDRLLTTTTRFWSVSGVSARFGSGGFELDVANLSALVQGGLAFDNLAGEGEAIGNGHVFPVYENRATASSETVEALEGPEVSVSILLDQDVSGLDPGAAVEFRGLVIGSVTGKSGEVDRAGDATRVLMRVDMRIMPNRLNITGEDVEPALVALLGDLVAAGYRARLASSGLLGNFLKVQIVETPDAAPATLERRADGRLILPSTGAQISDVAATARTALARINDVPIERITAAIADLLDNVNRVVASPELRTAPGALVGLLDDLRALVASDAVQGAVAGADASLARMSGILADLEEGEAVANVIAALRRADAIAAALQASAEALPDLIARVDAVAATASRLDLDPLVAAATGAVESASAILVSPEAQGLPAGVAAVLDDLSVAVGDVRSMAVELRDSDAVGDLTAALARAERITRDIETAAADLPALLAEARGLAATAGNLPLDAFAAQALALVEAADGIVGSEAARRLPRTLETALTDLGAAADDVASIAGTLNEGTALTTLMSALDRTDAIAASIETTAAGLPDLLARVDAVAAEAAALPLGELVTASTSLVETADGLIGSPEAAQVPQSLTEALDEVAAALAELRAGGLLENANTTLASASEAAQAISAAAAELPGLATDLEALIARTESVLATYGERSEFNSQTVAALRDLRDTARAVTSLARTIERKPNALLIGR